MKYAVDRIEENIAVLENIKTKEIKEISLEDLPKGIEEGNILKEKNDGFIIDKKEEENRRKRIEEKLNRLRVQ